MFECAMASAIGLLGNQLRIEILKRLMENSSLELNALQQMFPDEPALLATLNGLKEENLIFQKQDSYAMSEFGRNLVPVLGLLDKWNREDD